MSLALNFRPGRETQFNNLMSHAQFHPNTRALAQIIASWHSGLGVLPKRLGLSRDSFCELQRAHFGLAKAWRHELYNSRERLDARLDDLREDLLKLLQLHARDDSPSVHWIAQMIATACQGSNHLWEDLGVWERSTLSELFSYNFPSLAALNTRDMKWKKFLFKQLCETEGIYICRAPTCDQCTDFDDCFGPE
ncbi:nitrogen fixation protein NifQ [Aestuariirhabdus sp. LZHN29]|uniref:nitrogen fixation protein NifQ n=1 Tax=Aestuariirhabdus sp. LZHN29 TaxID=3417462 RepID=UPI003CF83D67